jgi:hypothetical protein
VQNIFGVSRVILERSSSRCESLQTIDARSWKLMISGNARARRSGLTGSTSPVVAKGSIDGNCSIPTSTTVMRSTTPPINILPSVVQFNKTDEPVTSEAGPRESREVASLLMAQRARTPVAIAVAQDYPFARFKIPRSYIVLGWFWVVDAWVRSNILDDDGFS